MADEFLSQGPSGPLTFKPMGPLSFRLMGENRVLLEIKPDGTVSGEIEDASEAAKVFVGALRNELQPMFDEAARRAKNGK